KPRLQHNAEHASHRERNTCGEKRRTGRSELTESGERGSSRDDRCPQIRNGMQDRGTDPPYRGTLQTHCVEADPDADADADIGEEDDHEVALIDLVDTLENAQSHLAARGRWSDDLNEFASEHVPR